MCLSRVYFTCTVFLGFFTSSFNLGMVTWRTPSVKSAWTFDFYHRGFIRDKKTDKDFWFNIVDVGLPPSLNGAFTQKPGISAADGTLIPQEMIARVQGERWQSVRSFKLEPGDWLVVDNKAVLTTESSFRAPVGWSACLLY
jgi:hypothetical protein